MTATQTISAPRRGDTGSLPSGLVAGEEPTTSTVRRIAIAAGGTGGHIYPGLAVARELTAMGHQVVFFGADDRMETRVVPEHGYRLFVSTIHGATSLRAKIALPRRLMIAGLRAATQLRQARVDAVIGMGGYPSSPAVVGAKLLGLPVVVHESNAVPGLANKLASWLGAKVAVSSDAARAGFRSASHIRLVGMPLMADLATLDRSAVHEEARAHFGISDATTLVIISGGSLGAAEINRVAAQLGTQWRHRTDVRLIIKTGPGAPALPWSPVTTTTPYLDRMDLAYAAADVMVTRAGAATVAELEHLGVPAVVIPLSTAAANHQLHNAIALANRVNDVVVLEEDDLTADRLASAITDLALRRRRQPPRSAVRSPHTQAARVLADWALDLI